MSAQSLLHNSKISINFPLPVYFWVVLRENTISLNVLSFAKEGSED